METKHELIGGPHEGMLDPEKLLSCERAVLIVRPPGPQPLAHIYMERWNASFESPPPIGLRQWEYLKTIETVKPTPFN